MLVIDVHRKLGIICLQLVDAKLAPLGSFKFGIACGTSFKCTEEGGLKQYFIEMLLKSFIFRSFIMTGVFVVPESIGGCINGLRLFRCRPVFTSIDAAFRHQCKGNLHLMKLKSMLDVVYYGTLLVRSAFCRPP